MLCLSPLFTTPVSASSSALTTTSPTTSDRSGTQQPPRQLCHQASAATSPTPSILPRQLCHQASFRENSDTNLRDNSDTEHPSRKPPGARFGRASARQLCCTERGKLFAGSSHRSEAPTAPQASASSIAAQLAAIAEFQARSLAPTSYAKTLALTLS